MTASCRSADIFKLTKQRSFSLPDGNKRLFKKEDACLSELSWCKGNHMFDRNDVTLNT